MTSDSILSQVTYPAQARFPFAALNAWRIWLQDRPNLHTLYQDSQSLPGFVRRSPLALRYLRLLGPLDWAAFPERDLQTEWQMPALPYAPFVAACLVKLDQQLPYMSHLRRFLVEHPALVWLLGFPLVPSARYPWGFDTDASLPTQRHLTRMLRKVPDASLKFLLDETVALLRIALCSACDGFGQTVAIDTKHVVAWVRQNNPKAYLKGKDRYDKTKQPSGDPDCRLGCKRRHNQHSRTKRASSSDPPPTPTDNPVPADTISVGEYYWGYASGIVTTKVADWGECVLAELTQSFDQPDVAYFFPLMEQTERRLGFRPTFGALDAAYDAHYVYDYFYRPGQHWKEGFAAVPLAQRGATMRSFDEQGLPLCDAGLSMPLKLTFLCRTTRFPHQRGRHVCPLRFPELSAERCPVNHKRWAKGGCVTTMATGAGARLRYQIDRSCALYKRIYDQRTVTERIFSQAVALGIQHPKLRNGQAIAHQNTLIYVLLNLRTLLRVLEKQAGQ